MCRNTVFYKTYKRDKKMYKTLKKAVLLFFLSLAVVCGSVFLAACGETPADGNTVVDSKVTYTVTVTSEVSEISLTSIKAQWLMINYAAASEEIALDENGKASVELDANVYTVILKGVPTDKATFVAAYVTATSPNANITLRAVSVSPATLDTPANVSISAGVLSWSSVANADGYIVYKDGEEVATLNSTTLTYTIPADLPEGTYSYTVVAKGDGVHYANSQKSVAAIYTV